MDDTHLPKMVFFSELATSGRNISRPLKRFKDGLTASPGLCGIRASGWETLATDRSAWKTAIDKCVQGFEDKQLFGLDQKRQARRERRPDPYCCRMPSVRLHLCVELCTAFSPAN